MFLAFFLVLTGIAQTPIKTAPLSIGTNTKHICNPDWKTHCKGKAEPTRQNRFECLFLKYEQLAPKCQQFIISQLKHIDCIEDATVMCKGISPTATNILKCLKPIEKQVSASCKEYLEGSRKSLEKEFIERDQICKADKEKFCPGNDPFQQNSCMIETHKKNLLSRPCYDHMKKTIGILRRAK